MDSNAWYPWRTAAMALSQGLVRTVPAPRSAEGGLKHTLRDIPTPSSRAQRSDPGACRRANRPATVPKIPLAQVALSMFMFRSWLPRPVPPPGCTASSSTCAPSSPRGSPRSGRRRRCSACSGRGCTASHCASPPPSRGSKPASFPASVPPLRGPRRRNPVPPTSGCRRGSPGCTGSFPGRGRPGRNCGISWAGRRRWRCSPPRRISAGISARSAGCSGCRRRRCCGRRNRRRGRNPPHPHGGWRAPPSRPSRPHPAGLAWRRPRRGLRQNPGEQRPPRCAVNVPYGERYPRFSSPPATPAPLRRLPGAARRWRR